MSSTSRAQPLSSVTTAARILREFGRHSTQLGVSQLARNVGVGKSTAHRVIWTLVEEGLLEKVEETGLFRLTATMRSLGSSAETAQRLHGASTIPLDKLRAHTRGTLHVAILEGTDVLYVERREGPGAVPVFRRLGTRLPAYATSTGKSLMAFLPTEQQRALVAQMRMVPKTPRTITTPTAFLAELARVRRLGYSENRGESQDDMCSVAAPVRDRLGHVVASVSVAEYTDDVEAGLPRMVGPVTETARRISAGLGWRE